MSKIYSVWNIIRRHKYLVVIVTIGLLVGVLDENSILNRRHRWSRLEELEVEIADYKKRYNEADTILRSLDADPHKVEQLAREMYYMKRADEDVFVVRTTEEEEEKLPSDTVANDSDKL